MAIIKKERHVLAKTWKHQNPVHCWYGCKIMQPLRKQYGGSLTN